MKILMNLFADYFEWNPKFFVERFSDEYLCLLSEQESHIVALDSESTLSALVEGNVCLSELSNVLASHQLLNHHQELARLFESGLIKKKGKDSDTFRYLHPDFSNQPVISSLNSGGVRVRLWCLTKVEGVDSLAESIFSGVTFDIQNIVIVDDYLDPRIGSIHKEMLGLKESWVVIKLTGEQAFLGPVFNASDGGCWQCLYHRLFLNNGLRWNRFSANDTSASSAFDHIRLGFIPVKDHFDLDASQKFALRTVLQSLLENKKKQLIVEINYETLNQTMHPIIKRPQCPSCGDKHLFKKQSLEPIKLTSTLKRFTKDGGVRTIDPEVTCQRLLEVISPFSGLLSHCSSVSKEGEYVNQIYRSGFFQNPTLNHYIGPISNATFLYTTMGKGISKQQSMASALSEGIERLASQYQGDEYVFSAVPPPNSSDYVLPQHLTPFTDQQYDSFDIQANPEHQLYASEKYLSDRPIHWTQVWSLTHYQPKFVPLSYCYANTPFDDQKFSRFYHNGGAAGNTLEEAILQGFFEIIERDAIAIWWYNQTPRRMIDFEGVSDELLKQLEHTIEAEWDYWTIDITTDFNIPVIAAISRNKTTGQFCFGFGCHIDAYIACQRALTELCQITEIRDRNTAPFDFDAIVDGAYLFPDSQPPCKLKDFETVKNADIKDDINHCLERARLLGLEVLVLNYSRPDMILNTAKVIIPGTCHIFPYFAVDRLYQVPVALGLLDNARHENNLNQQALLI
ncbi:TOMM precursor leader peptide-binding protein [Litoribacillus peritrichatus]